jgi:hypothetical protein
MLRALHKVIDWSSTVDHTVLIYADSNIYTRRVLARELQIARGFSVDLGLWDDNMKSVIIAHNGSVHIPNIPAER